MGNLYTLMGPNTGLGHNSMVFMIEAQIGYVLRANDYFEGSRARDGIGSYLWRSRD